MAHHCLESSFVILSRRKRSPVSIPACKLTVMHYIFVSQVGCVTNLATTLFLPSPLTSHLFYPSLHLSPYPHPPPPSLSFTLHLSPPPLTLPPSPGLLKFCPNVFSGQFVSAVYIQTDVIRLCVWCVCVFVCVCVHVCVREVGQDTNVEAVQSRHVETWQGFSKFNHH